jgi:ribosome-binding factor A
VARGNRPQRIAELVHKELAVLLRTEVKDHRVGMVSITHVQVTGDLSIARVYVTPLGGGGDGEAMLAGLKHAAGFLRGRVGRALKLRHAPKLDFRLDEHTENAVHMTSMLNRMEYERAEAEAAELGEE